MLPSDLAKPNDSQDRVPMTVKAGHLGRLPSRLALGIAILFLTLLCQVVTLSAGPVQAGGSPIVARIAGHAFVFAGLPHQGTIYLSKNGYDLINPGFDFETGQETSGFSQTPDLALDTSSGSPYSVSGDLAVLPSSDTIPVLTSQGVVPSVGEVLVVLDSGGRYVLVRIQAVSANALTFAYGFGTPEGRTSALGYAIWVAGHPLAFPEGPLTGQITLSANGEASVSPGFNFELHHQVSTLEEPAGLTAGTSSNGGIVLGGDLASIATNGHASDWPSRASVAASTGSNLLLVDNVGNYVLLHVQSVSPTAVTFQYRLLPARDVPVLPKGPVTLNIHGARVVFSGPVRYGSIVTAGVQGALINPGFDLVRDREVSGFNASPDIALKTMGQTLGLQGMVATAVELSAGEGPTPGEVPATPLSRFVVVDSLGSYVLVGLESVTAQVVTFAYEIQTRGATAYLEPPNPASVPALPTPKSLGTLVYSVYTGRGVVFQRADPATGGSVLGETMQLMKTYAYAIGPGRVFPFAGADAAEDPVLSPNGEWLATSAGGLISIRTAKGSSHTIATNRDVLGGAIPVMSWSPDSRYLAYRGLFSERGYDGGSALWVIEPSTGKSRLVVDPMRAGLGVDFIGWLPHDQLIFSTGKALYTVSADWTHVTRLPVRTGVMGQGGRFDVDGSGRLVTWVVRGANGHYQVAVATLDGKERVVFTQTRYDNWSPTFSPNGMAVAYVAGTGPAPGGELWVLTIDGKQDGPVAVPGTQSAFVHIFDLEDWYVGTSAQSWKGP